MKIKLKEIIGQYLSSASQGSHEFLRLWNLAVFGLKTEFNLDITGEVTTVILDVNANKTVNLPCNYIQYLKIGVLNGRGEVITFKRNDQLSLLDTGGTNRLAGAPTHGEGFPYPVIAGYPWNYGNYYFNGSYFNLFGADSGTQNLGEYKIDEENRMIYLNLHNHYPQIVLEYLSDGYEEGCSDFSIDVRAVQAMVAYVRWQNAIDQPKKFNQSQIQGFARSYYNQKRLAKVRLNPFILNEMRSAESASIKLVPKS